MKGQNIPNSEKQEGNGLATVVVEKKGEHHKKEWIPVYTGMTCGRAGHACSVPRRGVLG